MIKDTKAEELESKGLYRRAAQCWGEVVKKCQTDTEREVAINKLN
ncbi:PerC family transcriptional regulator [Pantoea sp. App145]